MSEVDRSAAGQTVSSAPPSFSLIVLTGALPGAMIRLELGGIRLGRAGDNAIQLPDESISRHHAFVSADDRGGAWLTDLGSTNGTYVNGRACPGQTPIRLKPGDEVRLGLSLTLKLVALEPREEEFQRALYERSVRDPLTGLYNRAYFLDQLPSMIRRSADQGLSSAVLIIDIDHFKQVNDTHGHGAGDEALRTIAKVVLEATRRGDLVARYGGEEFVVALSVPTVTQATLVAERIRGNVASSEIQAQGHLIRLTVSIGIAHAPSVDRCRGSRLIRVADRNMYRAKAASRNRVVS
jgi:diguanylate cyclase (GGDEF)-like protein